MSWTGNSNYSGLAIFTIEQRVKAQWTSVWTTAHPWFRVLDAQGTNFNKGFGISGLKMILPVLGDDLTNPAAFVADASETSTMTRNTTNGMGIAEYNFGHARASYSIKESEAKLAVNGARGNILEGKKRQFLDSFKNLFSDRIASTNADQSDHSGFCGIRQILSTSNTVGGISQTTDTQWAAQVTTGYGPFALEAVEEKVDAINAEGRFEADLALAAYSSSGTNVYSKYRSAISPAERYVNKDFETKYGLKNFMHMGLMVVMDNRIAAGELLVLSTPTWFCYIDRQPRLQDAYTIPLTDAQEVVGTAWGASGCCDPASNGRITGIT